MPTELVSGYCDAKFEKVAEVFNRSFESEFEVGASFAVEIEGEMVINLWGGHQDAQRSQAWQENTLVNVFSVTKGVTAICAARLIEQGRLDLVQKVSHYWPEYGCNGKENTTVLDLLCHRAGMFGFQSGVPLNQWTDWHQFTDLLGAQKPFAEPNSMQGYHALTFGWLVGELIRRVDGRSVGQYFKEELAEPLGLDFVIGMGDRDMARCADMLMLGKLPTIDQFKALRFVPDLFLSKALKDMKLAVVKDFNSVAFDPNAINDPDVSNTREWRSAEIPAANGHGVASSLAKLYGILSNGGSRNGVEVLKAETVELLRKVHSYGPDLVLFGLPYRFGLGHMVNAPFTPIGLNKSTSMFGHTGIGGAVVFGDMDKKVGFSYFNNQQHKDLKLYETSNKLAKTLYSLL
ncbi:MAG: beta-lactamase family protein [Porticoccaceae bacterium]|nr:beta-lactamase family protein [Porticoccaceae bacterium]